MTIAQRAYAGSPVSTTITGAITGTSLSITIADATGWPTGNEFYAVIDPGTATEEKILCTRSGTTISLASTAKRGVDGTSAASHSGGATIYPVIASPDVAEPNAALSKITSEGDLLTHSSTDFQRLGIGTNGLPLVVNTSVGGKMNWAQLGTGGIADDAVTSAKIATDAVGSAEIASGAVGSIEIADNAVTAAKIAAAVAGDGLAGGGGTALSVNVDNVGIEIATDTLQLKNAGVTAALSVNVDGTSLVIIADTLQVGAISGSSIGTGEIGSTQLAANSVGASQIATDAVGSAEIVAGAVGTSELADNSVTAAKIAAGEVGTSELATGAVTDVKIAADSVNSGHIVTGGVGTTELATSAVTAAKIGDGQVSRVKITGGRTGTWRRANTYQSVNNADAAAIVYDNEDSDPMGWGSGGTFICPETGTYTFTLLVKYETDTTSAMAIIQNYSTGEEWRNGAGAAYASQALSISITQPCTASEQYVFRTYHGAGSARNVNARMNIAYIGPN
jgi:trimeric autotransporter adhesin